MNRGPSASSGHTLAGSPPGKPAGRSRRPGRHAAWPRARPVTALAYQMVAGPPTIAQTGLATVSTVEGPPADHSEQMRHLRHTRSAHGRRRMPDGARLEDLMAGAVLTGLADAPVTVVEGMEAASPRRRGRG